MIKLRKRSKIVWMLRFTIDCTNGATNQSFLIWAKYKSQIIKQPISISSRRRGQKKLVTCRKEVSFEFHPGVAAIVQIIIAKCLTSSSSGAAPLRQINIVKTLQEVDFQHCFLTECSPHVVSLNTKGCKDAYTNRTTYQRPIFFIWLSKNCSCSLKYETILCIKIIVQFISN